MYIYILYIYIYKIQCVLEGSSLGLQSYTLPILGLSFPKSLDLLGALLIASLTGLTADHLPHYIGKATDIVVSCNATREDCPVKQ